jgi:hypothetical protein
MPPPPDSGLKVGDRRRFFDGTAGWQVTGDIGDNSCYFLPATVEKLYHIQGREVADLRFDHRPKHVSKAHFTDITRELDDEI